MRILIAAITLLCLAPLAQAQEELSAILGREYVAHWLVCGPFPDDVPGGIIAAALAGRPALGSTEFMQPAGGIANLRPRHLLQVPVDGEQAAWQEAGTDTMQFDLAPFFRERDEGIAYAAFYARARAARPVLMQIHSLAGARVWHNGLPIREPQPRPFERAGVDEFVANFTEGLNLIILELPGARLGALAAAAQQEEKTFISVNMGNRSLFNPTSGFDFALRLRPIAPLGVVYYVPRLENTGGFTRGRPPQQLAALTLFNTSRDLSPQVQIVHAVGGAEPQFTFLEPLAAAALIDVPLAIDAGGIEPGAELTVRVTLREQAREETFNTPVEITLPHIEGAIRVLPVWRPDGQAQANQSNETRNSIAAAEAQLAFHAEESAYGFDLGNAAQWEPLLRVRPDIRAALKTSAGLGEILARAAYSDPDQRLVAGESLLRNLRLGRALGERTFGATSDTDIAPAQHGLTPQWPQALALAGIDGIVSHTDVPLLPALFSQTAPDGTRAWHRRKAPIAAPGNLAEFRRIAQRQSAPLLQTISAGDLFILPLRVPTAPAYLQSATATLATGAPSISFSGGSADAYFSTLAALSSDARATIAHSTRLLTKPALAHVAAFPNLKRAHVRSESQLLIAERLATFAAVVGADFPAAPLEHAWRQLLYWSAPARLGCPASSTLAVDAMAGFRDVFEIAAEALDDAAHYLTSRTDTMGAGVAGTEVLRAIVVFDPSSAQRSDLCRLTFTLPAVPGMRLTDDAGVALPYEVEEAGMEGPRVTRVRMRFVAPDVPGLGYRTFHVTSGQGVTRATKRRDAVIQNSALVLMVDSASGEVMSLVDKATGEEFASGPLNRVMALPLDPEHSPASGALWTTGAPVTAASAQIETEVSALRQTLRITSPFLGGTLVRELSLHEGLDRVDAQVRLEGVDLAGHALALAFAGPHEGRAAVFGERFASVVGARSLGVYDHRVSGRENVSGSAMQPAHRYAALCAGDAIRVGLDAGVPLQPALVIHGEDPALERAAGVVADALARRGVPATVLPAELPKGGGPLDDATYPATGWDALAQEPGMRIVIGSPEQNAYCAAALQRLPAEAVARVAARAPHGIVAVAGDPLAGDRPPVTTVFVIGRSAQASGELAESMAEAIGAGGEYVLPPSAALNDVATELGATGLAVIYEGTALASVEQDGTLLVLPAIGGTEEQAPLQNDLVWHYAILPLQKDWRAAHLPQQGTLQSERFIAVATNLHTGDLPPSGVLLNTDAENFVVTAIEATGWLAREHALVAARDGVTLRGFESEARGGEMIVRALSQIRAGDVLDLRDRKLESAVIEDGAARLLLRPNQILSVSLQPRTLFSPDLQNEAPAPPALAATPGAYWRHNTGAPPVETPLSLILREEAGATRVTVANHSDKTLLGAIELKAAFGWGVTPERIPYALRPGDFMIETAVVQSPPDAGEGGVLATANSDGITVYDAAMIGAPPVEMRLSRTHAQIKAELYNASTLPAHGYLDIVTSPHLWPGEGPMNVAPRGGEVSVAPQETQIIFSRVSNPDAKIEAIARLAANGYVTYTPVPEHAAAAASEDL